jgi:hypothetical protein
VHNGVTIKQTWVFEDGGTQTAAAFVKNSKKTLFWPLYSILCPDLRLPRYDVSARPGDKIIRLVDDIPMASGLAYHVFAVSSQRTPVTVAAEGFHAVQFKHFTIVVYSNFMNVVTLEAGVSLVLPTSSPRLDGAPVKPQTVYEGIFKDGCVSLRDDELPGMLQYMNQTLFVSAVANMMDRLPEGHEHREWLPHHKPLFTVYPLSAGRPLVMLEPPPVQWSPPKPE